MVWFVVPPSHTHTPGDYPNIMVEPYLLLIHHLIIYLRAQRRGHDRSTNQSSKVAIAIFSARSEYYFENEATKNLKRRKDPTTVIAAYGELIPNPERYTKMDNTTVSSYYTYIHYYMYSNSTLFLPLKVYRREYREFHTYC